MRSGSGSSVARQAEARRFSLRRLLGRLLADRLALLEAEGCFRLKSCIEIRVSHRKEQDRSPTSLDRIC
jgi:hypothetical protein